MDVVQVYLVIKRRQPHQNESLTVLINIISFSAALPKGPKYILYSKQLSSSYSTFYSQDIVLLERKKNSRVNINHKNNRVTFQHWNIFCLFFYFAETVRAMTHVINQGMAMYWGTSRWSPMEIMVRLQKMTHGYTGKKSIYNIA